jgi:hypothetical protein
MAPEFLTRVTVIGIRFDTGQLVDPIAVLTHFILSALLELRRVVWMEA